MYGVLPSYVRDNATTFDIMVADVMAAWEQSQSQKNNPDSYSEEQLLKIMENHK